MQERKTSFMVMHKGNKNYTPSVSIIIDFIELLLLKSY